MPSAAELKSTYYDRGEFDNCLDKVEQELNALSDHPEKSELLALAGWCKYRQAKHEEARNDFLAAGLVRFAREGLAYLAVYIDHDDDAFQALAQELGDSVNIQNARVIRAREKRDGVELLTHEQVLEIIARFRSDDGVEVANLYHNAGRFFLHKSRGGGDLVISLGLFEMARVRYGIDRNWHHRGAIHYWRSRVLEDLLDRRAALEAARDSLYCWTQQVILDPQTKRHQEYQSNAVERIRVLVAALSKRA